MTITKNQLENTYFNFTKDKTSLQAGKIEKSLDIIVRYDMDNTEKTASKKVMVFDKLIVGFLPGIEENYSFYSPRKGDYTKPKTLYKLENEEGTYVEINKTLYDYALYLIDNNFIDPQAALNFIKNEQEEMEKADQERLLQEEKERQEQAALKEKEEQERKETIAKKQAAWKEKGEKFISSLSENPISKLLENHWENVKELYPEQDKTAFFEAMTDKFLIMMGNESYCEHWFKYYIENDNKSVDEKYNYTIENNPIRFFERELLYSVFNNVSFSDSPQTISAKVKAILNIKEYKGSRPAKEYTFYYLHRDNGFVEDRGTKHIINGIICYMQQKDNKYCLIEERTGVMLNGLKDSKKQALEDAKEKIARNKNKLEKSIQGFINRHGSSPLLHGQELSV